jgi:hypothetical protein
MAVVFVVVVVKIPSVVGFPPLAAVVRALFTKVVRRLVIVVGCIVGVVVVVVVVEMVAVEVVGFADDAVVEALVVVDIISVEKTGSDVKGVVSLVVGTVLYGVVVSEI